MPIYLANDSTPVAFSTALPADRKLHLKGGRVLAAITGCYEFIVEEIRKEFFVIRHNSFRFDKRTTVSSRSAEPGIHSRFMLSGGLTHSIKNLGDFRIAEGQAAALYGESADCTVIYEPAKEYVSLDIFFAPSLAGQLAEVFPELQEMLSKDGMHLITKHPCFISPSMKDVIRQLLECPFDAATSEFYFELKVREVLYVILEQAYRDKKSKNAFKSYETEKLVQAKDYLLSDLGRTPTIRELSRIVAINEFKLKSGFRQLFGMGVFECLQEARMEKARELLLSTDKPLKELCVLTGYRRTTNFITAFRKRFGYTPNSLRRER